MGLGAAPGQPGVVAREDRSLTRVLDEHAELRGLLRLLEETRDVTLASGLLDRLLALSRTHFEEEEAPGGLFEALRATAPGEVLARLEEDHRGLLASIRDLAGRLGEGPASSLDALQVEIRGLLHRLREHDAVESRWLSRLLPAPETGLDTAPSLRSEALEINLLRTAVDVVVPDRHAVLLEITAHLEGVHASARRLLREIHHPYVGWAETVEDLHRHAMGHFPHFASHPRAPEALAVFGELYEKCAREARPSPLRETALRNHLHYLEKIVRESGDRLPELAPLLETALGRLREIVEEIPSLHAALSSRWKRLATLFGGSEPLGEAPLERCLSLVLGSLRCVYEKWLAVRDPVDVWREGFAVSPSEPPPPSLSGLSHAHLRGCLARLDGLAAEAVPLSRRAEELLSLPDEGEIERAYLEAAPAPGRSQVEDARIQTRWLLHLLAEPALSGVHEQVLFEINRSALAVLRGPDRRALVPFVREIFSNLRRNDLRFSGPALHLVSRIGREVLASADPEAAEVVVDAILEGDFPPPSFAGFTEEWQVRVDPGHLRAIRAILSIVEADPSRARRLLAALVLHLRAGGTFVADTDLFQKDVSSLLRSPIGPVFHTVKQLVRLLPVFFHDIGAEGELRDASTRIDEIASRRDPLCHFLRKQCHVESNPLLLRFVEAIARFWAAGDPEEVRPFVPESLCDSLDGTAEMFRVLRAIFSELAAPEEVPDLFRLDPSLLDGRLRALRAGSPSDREKVRLLFRLHSLLRRKYTPDPTDLLERLRAFPAVEEARVRSLRDALGGGRTEEAIEILLELLEILQRTLLDPRPTEAIEDIYRKRHVAAGIPSIYGQYREPKFNAMGLTLRIESLVRSLFDRLFAEEEFAVVTRGTLRRVARWLRLLRRALRVDGCRGRGLATGIAMLEQGLASEGFRLDQVLNVFQFLSHGTELLIRIRFLDVYEPVLERIGDRLARSGERQDGGDAEEARLRASEGVLRDLVAQSFGVQHLDLLVTRVLRALQRAKERFDERTREALLAVDLERAFVPIDAADAARGGALALGNKGLVIRRLAADGFPVPDGFILTTDLFRFEGALRACEELRAEATRRLRGGLARLEERSGCRFGDPSNPLLLSVRSSPVISMPGILDTFLNVGLTAAIAEGLASRPERSWSAWDAYRRFLQFWGMSRGIERDRFDGLLREAKRRDGVLKKSHLPARRMREVAFAYGGLLLDHGIPVPDDPFEQLEACVLLVLRSWDAEKARIYRSRMQIAEEWGTAVLVQEMVYGNLHERSGTGVVLTCDPRHSTEDVRLVGDFVVQGQGDDVVSGLVETFPISAAQRSPGAEGAGRSLQEDFPGIYDALARHARALILDHGMFHQEIEFTFEGDAPEDLYLLQSRDIVLSSAQELAVFVPGESLDRARIATGIGAAGGALSGRVAHRAGDLAELRRRFPGEPIVLLRPDTVPDDIPLILQADGILTALGGATSHAAIAAQRLGRACVVGCRALQVDEAAARSTLAGREVRTGDLLSINGVDGSIYLGRHPTTVVPQRRGFV